MGIGVLRIQHSPSQPDSMGIWGLLQHWLSGPLRQRRPLVPWMEERVPQVLPWDHGWIRGLISYQAVFSGGSAESFCCSVAKSCPTLFDSMHCSMPGSSVCGISQARILEWIAISFSRGSSWLRNQTRVSCCIEPLGIINSLKFLTMCIYSFFQLNQGTNRQWFLCSRSPSLGSSPMCTVRCYRLSLRLWGPSLSLQGPSAMSGRKAEPLCPDVQSWLLSYMSWVSPMMSLTLGQMVSTQLCSKPLVGSSLSLSFFKRGFRLYSIAKNTTEEPASVWRGSDSKESACKAYSPWDH